MPAFTFSELHPLSQGQLRVESDGAGVRFHVGFMHRGDEKLLEVRDFRQGLSLMNRHNWLSPVAAEVAYAQACEELMGIRISDKVAATRTALLAMQELTGLLQRLAGIFNDAQWLRIREEWVELTETITGARLHVSAIRIGGTIAEITADVCKAAAKMSVTLPSIDAAAWHGRGVLTAEVIDSFSITAVPTQTHDAAERIEFTHARAQQLVTEIPVLLTAALIDGPTEISLPKVVRVPVGESYATALGATGRVGVWVFSDGGKSPERVALRSPSAIHLSAIEAVSHRCNHDDVQALLETVPLALGEIDR